MANEAIANRRATIESLLQPGVRHPTGFEELGVDPEHHHLGIVLWFPTAGASSLLETLARQITERTQASTVLTIPGGHHDLWMWLSFAAPPSPTVYESIRGIPRDAARIGLAAGPVAAKISGFRRTHLLAQDYASVARWLPSNAAPRVADSESVSFVSLLLHDRERAEWFVSTELGDLGTGTSASDVESRDTLRIYLETGQSLAETAARLRIHRNTVVYRLRRIEQSLGLPVASRRHELYAASLLAHLLTHRNY
ncbi:PucR family transcriptional regulator [Paenarthrobacter ureafaciens]|uniref:PucR family transcriptional regulator n=1 Tax=Paenarthrobacter ureafaciens TaxID=37931 RepID=UPI002DB7179D|nr:helix-turn-helix domain-containing protein [Paenarthrobacter ureafaciens]MEC3853902.1 helix-turn-helix domain-containing protein [Paenarthrobacter ureafaciens]